MAKNGDFTWLTSLILNNDKSDVKVYVQDGEKTVVIPAHSLVLCAHSDVFSAMLESNRFEEGRTGEITLQGYSPRAVEYFLRYLYTKNVPEIIPIHHILELLQLSHQYEIPDLLNECHSILVNSFAVDTVCKVYQTAALLDLKILQSECLLFIRQNLEVIEKNNLHFVLPLECLEASFFLTSTLKSDSILHAKMWYSCLKGEINEECEQLVSKTDDKELRFMGPFSWLIQMFMDNSNSDIDIVLDDNSNTIFPAHSLVLMCQSPVLHSQCNALTHVVRKDDTKCRHILRGLNAREAEYFLRFLYTQELPVQIYEENLVSLLRAAQEYQVEFLKQTCIKDLKVRLSVSNCCQLLVLAKDLKLTELEEASMTKIVHNWDQVLENHLHFVLCKQSMKEVQAAITSTSIESSKTTEFIKEWAKWRTCLQNLGSNFFPGLVDPVLAAALKVIVTKYQICNTITSSDTSATVLNFWQTPCVPCTVVPSGFDYLSNAFTFREPFSEEILFTLTTDKMISCAGFKLYILGLDEGDILDCCFSIRQGSGQGREFQDVSFGLNVIKKYRVLLIPEDLYEVKVDFKNAVVLGLQSSFKILSTTNKLYLPNYLINNPKGLTVKCSLAEVTFKYLHSCVENVVLMPRAIKQSFKRTIQTP